MSWDPYDLFTKAQLYVDRAYRNLEETSVFVHWNLLALELLARSAIATIHPVLVANPNDIKSLYYAVGRKDLCSSPKSIHAKTLYERCETLFPEFTKAEKKFCHAFRELRNAEIHSGEAVLEPVPIPNWSLKYYRVCQVLLESMEKGLDDFFPPDHVPSIVEMLKLNEREEEAAVRKLIAAAKTRANVTDINLRRYSDSLECIVPSDIDFVIESKKAICPVCISPGEVELKRVSLSETRLVDDFPFRKVTYIPITYSCGHCQLLLDNYGRMVMAGMGDPVVTEIEIDLMELFMEYMEPDYGNE